MNSKNKVMKKISNVVGKRRFLFLLFLIFTTQISLNAYSQERKITFSLKNASLKEIISEIRKNSDYDFVYRDVNLESFARQDVAFKDATIEQILTDCLKGTNLGYEINGRTIIIRKKAVSQEEKNRKQLQVRFRMSKETCCRELRLSLKVRPWERQLVLTGSINWKYPVIVSKS